MRSERHAVCRIQPGLVIRINSLVLQWELFAFCLAAIRKEPSSWKNHEWIKNVCVHLWYVVSEKYFWVEIDFRYFPLGILRINKRKRTTKKERIIKLGHMHFQGKRYIFHFSFKLIFISSTRLLFLLYITNTSYQFCKKLHTQILHVCSHTISIQQEQWQHFNYYNVCLSKYRPKYTLYQQKLKSMVSWQHKTYCIQCAYLWVHYLYKCLYWHEFVCTAAKVVLLDFIERNGSALQFYSFQQDTCYSQ